MYRNRTFMAMIICCLSRNDNEIFKYAFNIKWLWQQPIAFNDMHAKSFNGILSQ